ncbi:MAG: c-type cytochrome [Actinomycetota bacterium]|nr:c-type cytochrome [Actinomycetota bacterium]
MGRGWRPLVVGAIVVIATFVLARLTVFEPSAPTVAGTAGGDVYRGQVVFERECSSCHGQGGEGGSPGPRLSDTGLAAAEVIATIEQGRGVMPRGLTSGQEQADAVAYVVSISRP